MCHKKQGIVMYPTSGSQGARSSNEKKRSKSGDKGRLTVLDLLEDFLGVIDIH